MLITHSKDGVAIPDEGVSFEVKRGPEGNQTITTLVLHDLLAGLNMKVTEGKTQSQAASFASFAVQSDFLDEKSILDKYWFARPREVILDNGEAEIECRSWGLISTWEDQIKDARSKAARATLREAGAEMSAGQIAEAMRLIPLLRAKMFDAVADTLHGLIQVNEEMKGPHGASISASIGQGQKLLNMSTPRTQGAKPTSSDVTHTSDTKVDESPKEPF